MIVGGLACAGGSAVAGLCSSAQALRAAAGTSGRGRYQRMR